MINHTEMIDTLIVLFSRFRHEMFEDGEMSRLVEELMVLIDKHGDICFDALMGLIDRSMVDPHVSSEALRWIGRMNDSIYYQKRKWLLECSLSNSSIHVTDGALLGLGAMDDPYSLPFVEKALTTETNVLLRQNMQQLIDQLKGTIEEDNE